MTTQSLPAVTTEQVIASGAREQLGLAPDDDKQDNEIAVELAAQRIGMQTGRVLATRTIFDYVGYAEKLTERAQALARAYRFGVRDLARLARLDASVQEAEAEALARATGPAATEIKPQANDAKPAPEIGGRPTRAQRAVNLCVGLIGHIARMLPRLERFGTSDLQVMRDAAQQAEASLAQYRHSIEGLLNREK
jgi:hypothetical protein